MVCDLVRIVKYCNSIIKCQVYSVVWSRVRNRYFTANWWKETHQVKKGFDCVQIGFQQKKTTLIGVQSKKNYSLGLNVNWKAGTLAVVSRILCMSYQRQLNCSVWILFQVLKKSLKSIDKISGPNSCLTIYCAVRSHHGWKGTVQYKTWQKRHCTALSNAKRDVMHMMHCALCTVQQNKNLKYK